MHTFSLTFKSYAYKKRLIILINTCNIHLVSKNIAPPSDFQNGGQGTMLYCMKTAYGFFDQPLELSVRN